MTEVFFYETLCVSCKKDSQSETIDWIPRFCKSCRKKYTRKYGVNFHMYWKFNDEEVDPRTGIVWKECPNSPRSYRWSKFVKQCPPSPKLDSWKRPAKPSWRTNRSKRPASSASNYSEGTSKPLSPISNYSSLSKAKTILVSELIHTSLTQGMSFLVMLRIEITFYQILWPGS